MSTTNIAVLKEIKEMLPKLSEKSGRQEVCGKRYWEDTEAGIHVSSYYRDKVTTSV